VKYRKGQRLHTAIADVAQVDFLHFLPGIGEERVSFDLLLPRIYQRIATVFFGGATGVLHVLILENG
jgi:hypothetical protein